MRAVILGNFGADASEAEVESELMPEINPMDLATAEAAGSIKVHVELPNGEIVSFRADTVRSLMASGIALNKLDKLRRRGLAPAARPGPIRSDSNEVTSANLTEFAMTLNMELGILVRGGTEPREMAAHLLWLVEQRYLVQVGD